MTILTMHTEQIELDDVRGFAVPFLFLMAVAIGAGAAVGIGIAPTGAEHLGQGTLQGRLHR